MGREIGQLCSYLFVFLLGLNGCSDHQRPVNNKADIASIESLEQQLNDAYLNREWESFSSFFTEDGVWMPPNQKPLKGKEAWWEFVEGFWDAIPSEATLISDEIVVMGNWAYERHHDKTVFRSPDGSEMIYYSKGIHILERQTDGEWKIARYIWNDNPPSP